MPYYVGIDIGASRAKLVLMDDRREVVAKSIRSSGIDYVATAEACLADALAAAGVAGRDRAHGFHGLRARQRGLGRRHDDRNRLPRQRGLPPFPPADHRGRHRGPGQQGHPPRRRRPPDRFQDEPQVRGGHGGFSRRDRAPIGPPRCRIERHGPALDQGSHPGELLHGLHGHGDPRADPRGEKVEDIVKGAFRSVVKRIVEMDTPQGTLVLTGGVAAHNPILATLMAESFGREALVPPDPQFIGAFGAALFALEAAEDGKEEDSRKGAKTQRK